MGKVSAAIFLLFLTGSLWAQEAEPLPLIAAVSGNYKGSAPCDDCKIIETELELNYETDSTGLFSLRDKYVGNHGSDMMSRIKGEWMMEKKIIDTKTIITIILNFDTPEKALYYLRKPDGGLLPIDSDRKPLVAATDLTLKKT